MGYIYFQEIKRWGYRFKKMIIENEPRKFVWEYRFFRNNLRGGGGFRYLLQLDMHQKKRIPPTHYKQACT